MRHLKDSNMSYGQHLVFALKLSLDLAVMAVIGVIHAIIPYLFQNSVSSGVKRVDDLLQEKAA